MGGGLPMPEFFGPLFRSAFLVNKKSLFLQKCQCTELLTVFYVVNISPSPPLLVLKWLSNLEFWSPKDQVARIGVRGGGWFRWFGQCPKENVFFSLMSSLSGRLNPKPCLAIHQGGGSKLLTLYSSFTGNRDETSQYYMELGTCISLRWY